MFGGTAGDTTALPSHDEVAGKIVILKAAPGGAGFGGRGGGRGGAALRAFADAAAIATVTETLSPAPALINIREDHLDLGMGTPSASITCFTVTPGAHTKAMSRFLL